MTRLLIATSDIPWDRELASVLAHPAMGIDAILACQNFGALQNAITDYDVTCLVVTEDAEQVDDRFVIYALAANLRVIAVAHDPHKWLHLGVRDCLVVGQSSPVAIAKRIAALLCDNSKSTEILIAPENRMTGSASAPDCLGTGIAVVGFGGGSGRTSCVRELSYSFTQINSELLVLMADADTFGASLAQELGDNVIGRNLLNTCRAIESGKFTTKSWPEHVSSIHRNLYLLPGISQASRWADLRPAALKSLWQSSMNFYDVVVTDVGPGLDLDKPLPHTEEAHRNSALMSVLASCTHVVLCARADTIGITRLVRGYLEFGSTFDEKPITVVVSGVQSQSQSKDIQRAITRHTGLTNMYFVPELAQVYHQANSHNTFASLLDERVLTQFKLIADAIVSARPKPTDGVQVVSDYLKVNVA